MNFSTTYKDSAKSAKRRQSIYTLTFFCFLFILMLSTSCSENIFQTPYGNRSLVVDTLHYDHHFINAIKNINTSASGSILYQNKAGNYNDLSADFLIKFTNFISLSGIPDSVEITINQADVILYPADYWGNESTVSLDIHMVNNDTSLYWENISPIDELITSLDGQTSYYTTMTFSPDIDSLRIPIDLATVNDWHVRPDSLYVNNGFTVKKSNDSEGMIAFYSIEYSFSENDKRPRLLLECSLHDTNGVYLQDSIFYVIGGGDIQFTESQAVIDDSLFYLSQGNIFRSYIELDSIRQDTLLGPTHLLNKAEQILVMHPLDRNIALGDTLQLTARLFKTDMWVEDSLNYMYTAYSNRFTDLDDTIRIDISQLLQYLVSNPKEMLHEGIFYYLNNEYNDFNYITIIPALSELDIIYTRVNNE